MHKNLFFRIESFLLMGAGCLLLATSCSPASGDETGHEFIPDMAHPVSYEANLYANYSLNSWDDESVISRRELSQPRQPVAGTIARGYSGTRADNAELLDGGWNANSVSTPPNGSVPYHYVDTEDDRLRATAEITQNPFPITATGIEKGKELYTIYCGICHGDKADGAGYLVRDDGGVYPAQPANLVSEDFIAASEGRFYHAIMYGKNVMGGYSDKLSYEERWDVIHYIRSLQAANQGKTYAPETPAAVSTTEANTGS